MQHIVKASIILVIELNLYCCLGCVMEHMFFLPKVFSPVRKIINGFLGYHCVFWCVAFCCTYLSGSLFLLTNIWLILIGVFALYIFLNNKIVIQVYKDMLDSFRRYKFYIVPCLLLQIFLIYYIGINGQADVDARTYIGEVTTMVDTGKLIGFSPTSGQMINTLSLKRSVTMFGANSAVLCNIFKIHPLVFCRTVRAIIDIIMLAMVVYEIFKCVYWKYEDKIEHAIMTLMLAQSSLFLFANSIYTSSAFILHRTYEGKAYCSGVLVLLILYLAIRVCGSKDRRFFILIFMGMITGMSISASASFLLPLVAGSVICAYIVVEHKWNYIVPLFLSLAPNIVFIMMSITGFARFALEG